MSVLAGMAWDGEFGLGNFSRGVWVTEFGTW